MANPNDNVMRVTTPEAGTMPVQSRRVADLILYLVNNQRRIGSMAKGEVRFAFHGRALTASSMDYEDLTKRG